jgi:hypothetical protein
LLANLLLTLLIRTLLFVESLYCISLSKACLESILSTVYSLVGEERLI